MANQTQGSQYLLAQEHITDKEIDELYDFAGELQLQLSEFREYDKKYRSLETVNTAGSEKERAEILNACTLILEKLTTILKDMASRNDLNFAVYNKTRTYTRTIFATKLS